MITFTDRAREMIRSFLDQSEDTDLALLIRSSGASDEPGFDLTLVPNTGRPDDECEIEIEGLKVLFPESDAQLLDGAIVDYVERVNESGFEVQTTSGAGAAPSRPEREPTGEIAERVRTVLETQVNPAIAAHGGMITLVDVEDTDVYVEMSGGCQGCALSRMTLRQGVERMLRDAVPELTAVHDVTDHASGVNPYM